jgi:hypothetical protein
MFGGSGEWERLLSCFIMGRHWRGIFAILEVSVGGRRTLSPARSCYFVMSNGNGKERQLRIVDSFCISSTTADT